VVVTFKLAVVCEAQDPPHVTPCGRTREFIDKPISPDETAAAFAERAAARLRKDGWLLEAGAADLCPDHT
jgi:cytidine deaminase